MKDKILNKYRAKGWAFTTKPGYDYHHRTDEIDEFAQSPRTEEPFHFSWLARHNDVKHEWATEKGLLKAEAEAFASQLLETAGGDSCIFPAIVKAVLAGKPDATSVTFTVTLS